MRSNDTARIVFAILIVIVLAAIFFIPRTDEEAARSALESSGFTDIEITGFEPWMLGRDDFYSTGFRATGPNGNRVEGAVTGGVFKGSTIRFK